MDMADGCKHRACARARDAAPMPHRVCRCDGDFDPSLQCGDGGNGGEGQGTSDQHQHQHCVVCRDVLTERNQPACNVLVTRQHVDAFEPT